jgi:hypothetical protein
VTGIPVELPIQNGNCIPLWTVLISPWKPKQRPDRFNQNHLRSFGCGSQQKTAIFQMQRDRVEPAPSGEGVVKDEVEAVKRYRRAAGQHYAEAQYVLGVCYYNGQGVAKHELGRR